jgi:hypothetical protein
MKQPIPSALVENRRRRRGRIDPFLYAAAAQLRIASNAIREAVDHPGEIGRGHEMALGNQLQALLPARIDIRTGSVIGAGATISRQLDLVLVDRLRGSDAPPCHAGARGPVPIAKLTPEHVRILLAKLAGAGLSATTCAMTRDTLSTAMRRAVKDRLIAFNPLEAVDTVPRSACARLRADRAPSASPPPRSRG